MGAFSRFVQIALMCSSIIVKWCFHFRSKVRWIPKYLTGADAGTRVAGRLVPLLVNTMSGALASVVVFT